MEALLSTQVGTLLAKKRPIISIPDTATVQAAVDVMIANDIVALPVAARPGKWMGAGQSLIIDRDKQYIGMVSMIDVAMHVAAWGCDSDGLGRPVIDLIGNSPEGLSMWVYDHHTKLSDVMEPLSKGVHRLLVHYPPTQQAHEAAGEAAAAAGGDVSSPPASSHLAPSSPLMPTVTLSSISSPRSSPSEYFFLSQTDVVSFLLAHIDDLGPVAQRTVADLSLVDPRFPPLAVSENTTVLNALQLLRRAAAGIRAVAVVAAEDEPPSSAAAGSAAAALDPWVAAWGAAPGAEGDGEGGGGQGSPGKGKGALAEVEEEDGWKRGGRLLGTLSVSDLRGVSPMRLKQLGIMTVRDFLAGGLAVDVDSDSGAAAAAVPTGGASIQGKRKAVARVPVVCRPETPLATVMALATTNRVHRVWVTVPSSPEEGEGVGEEGSGELVGVVSMSDIIAAVRRAALSGGIGA